MRRIAIVISLLFAFTAAASNDLTGTVVDAQAKPISGAHVYVYTAVPKMGASTTCPSCCRDCGKRREADERGAFRLEALDRTVVFDVLAVADGYEPAFARKVDPAFGPITIELKPRAMHDAHLLVSGVVVDADGKPVVGAIVEPNGYRVGTRVGYGDVPGGDKLSITNAKGEFALRVPSADAKLDVRVTARALAPKIDRMLAPGESRRITLTPGAAISGRIMRAGQPVAGATVKAVQRNRASRTFLGESEIATNEHGYFVMTSIAPNETYILSVDADGVLAPKAITVGDEGSSVDAGTLELEQGRRIAGQVIVPEGMDARDFVQVVLEDEASGARSSARIARDGTFAFPVVARAAARLTLNARGAYAEPVVVPAGGDCTDVRIVLARE
jgi:hypothetical protein